MPSLYAVENAVTVRCRSCRRPIDIWHDHGLTITRQGMARCESLTKALCSECLVLTYPAEEREKLTPAYEHQRVLPREAGIPPWVTTYVLSTEGKPGTWAEGYLAIGYAAQVRGWDYASAERQPHVTIIPDDPSDSPLSLVFFAGKVLLDTVTWAFLKFIWPFDLSLPERFEVVNGLDPALRDAELDRLVRGRRFWRTTIGSGRDIGATSWPREEFLYELPRTRQKLHMRYGRKPTNVELAIEMGIPISTFYRYKRNWLRGRPS